MTQDSFLIVGGGIAGLATAWGLARRGAPSITLVEREPQLGYWSSGRNAGILRTAIHAPATRRLALESAKNFHAPDPELLRFADQPLFDPVGLIVCEGGPALPEPAWLDDLQAAQACEPLPAGDLRSKVPHYTPEGERLWWLPKSGRIRVGALVSAFAGALEHMGVQLRLGSEVTGLEKDSAGQVHGARLGTGEVIEADQVVLAPGAWVQNFAEPLGLTFPARTTRRHLFFASPGVPLTSSDPIVWDDTAGFYFMATGTGEVLLCLCDEDDADPDRLIEDPLFARLVQRRANHDLARLGPWDWKRSLVGIRTVSEDDVPMLARHPGQERLAWVAALGGHGITLSLGLAERAADWLTGTPIDPGLEQALSWNAASRDYQAVREYPVL